MIGLFFSSSSRHEEWEGKGQLTVYDIVLLSTAIVLILLCIVSGLFSLFFCLFMIIIDARNVCNKGKIQ
jgi:hypothetical protein